MTSALDTLEDPFLTPLLALLMEGVNADVAALAAPDAEPEPAVRSTAPHPVALEIAGESALPLLSCYRVRSRGRQRSIAYVDHTVTLQIAYTSPATAREQLSARWPLLEVVWQSILGTIRRGYHAAHQGGIEVLGPLGVIEVPLASAQKRELFAADGDYAYPSFLAEVDVILQTASFEETGTLHPALSFTHNFYLDGVRDDVPDVAAISFTPEGELVPYEPPV